MKKTNYLRNITLAFLLFFIGQFLIRYLGNYGSWIILGGVVIFYIVWWRNYHAGKNKDNELDN